jgi:cell division protein FtsQ
VKRKKAKANKRPLAVNPNEVEAKFSRISWPLIIVLILVTGSALTAFQVVNYLGRAPLFGLKALEVDGLQLLNGEDVLAASGLAVGTNIFSVDLDEVERRLEQMCWIEQALVVRKPPDRLAVEIVERRRLAWVELGATYGIAADGVLLPVDRAPGESFADLNLPVISGLKQSADTLVLGEAVPDSTLMAILRWWGEALAADAEFCQNVSEIQPMTGGGGIRLRMVGDGLEVRLPVDRVARRLRTLRAVMPRVYREYRDPAYIDLRYAGQVIVRNKEAESG